MPLERMVKELERAGIDLAVLFGSRATGRASARSDWDVGVLAPPEVDPFALSAQLGRTVGGRVDVVDLRRAAPLLCFQVAREGKVLVDRTGSEFARFASLALRRYHDTAKLRRAQAESLARFVALLTTH